MLLLSKHWFLMIFRLNYLYSYYLLFRTFIQIHSILLLFISFCNYYPFIWKLVLMNLLLYSGGIKIVDISKTNKQTNNESGGHDDDDCVIAQTDSKDDHHLDLITSLNWVKSSDAQINNVKVLRFLLFIKLIEMTHSMNPNISIYSSIYFLMRFCLIKKIRK